MNAKDEINRAIGVVKARMDYLINHENFENEEYEALCRATCSLEKWRDDDCTHYLPEIAGRLIWFKQQAQVEGVHGKD